MENKIKGRLQEPIYAGLAIQDSYEYTATNGNTFISIKPQMSQEQIDVMEIKIQKIVDNNFPSCVV